MVGSWEKADGPESGSGPSFGIGFFFLALGRAGALDLDRRDADAITLLEHLVVGHRLAVDADHVVPGLQLGKRCLRSCVMLMPGSTSMWSAKPPPWLLMKKIRMVVSLRVKSGKQTKNRGCYDARASSQSICSS